MNFLKTFFAILFAHRVMSVIITIVLGFVLFYTVSDLEFMNKMFEGAMTWITNNMNAMVQWITEAVSLVLSKF